MSNVIWLRGRSGAGKTTIGSALVGLYQDEGLECIFLDGDDMRRTINYDLGFSEQDRIINHVRIARLAELLSEQVDRVVVATIVPTREVFRAITPYTSATFITVCCPEHVASSRDPKGLYAKKTEFIYEDVIQTEFQVDGTVGPHYSALTIRNYLKDNHRG